MRFYEAIEEDTQIIYQEIIMAGPVQDEFLDLRVVYHHEPALPVLLLCPPRLLLVHRVLPHPQLPSRPQHAG